IALLALMLVPAAFNLLIVRPRLARVAVAGSASASRLARRFALAVRGEAALAMVILLVAAVLTGFSPAREELARQAGGALQGGPVDRQVNANGLSARIQINPATLGINRLAVQLPGTDPAQVERVSPWQLDSQTIDAQRGGIDLDAR